MWKNMCVACLLESTRLRNLTQCQMTRAKESAASQWAEAHPAGRDDETKKVDRLCLCGWKVLMTLQKSKSKSKGRQQESDDSMGESVRDDLLQAKVISAEEDSM